MTDTRKTMGEGLKAMVGDGVHECVCGKRLLVVRPSYLAMVRCPFCKTTSFMDVVGGRYAMRPMTDLEFDRLNQRPLRMSDLELEDMKEMGGIQ